jgi:flagella basal body P-ring formation protein FlgA
MIDGGHVHIRIPVICLENGVPGQTIRATDKEHHRIYIAQVIEDGLLQARI